MPSYRWPFGSGNNGSPTANSGRPHVPLSVQVFESMKVFACVFTCANSKLEAVASPVPVTCEVPELGLNEEVQQGQI